MYRFEPDPAAPGRWKRTDLDIWCAKQDGRWVVVDSEGNVTGGPESAAAGTEPPAGPWWSAKGAKRYRYELCWLD